MADSSIDFVEGDTRILVVSPHFDDDFTNVVARTVDSEAKCSALINNSVPKKERDYNVFKKTKADPFFIGSLRKNEKHRE